MFLSKVSQQSESEGKGGGGEVGFTGEHGLETS